MNDGAVTLGDGYQWFDDLAVLPIDDAGMLFFSSLGYFDKCTEAAATAGPSKKLVYSQLPEGKFLTDVDRAALSSIDSCAKLGTFRSDEYEIPSTDIDVYAVDLKDSGSLRSEDAYNVHTVFSKFNDNPSVVFFRSENAVMLSFLQAIDESAVAVYLSDWLTADTEDFGQLERLHIASCSLASSYDLFDSLEFEAIRDYYKYPVSRYIAAYDVVFPSVNLSTMIDLSAFTREDQNEAIESVLDIYVVKYGDDYIDNSIRLIDQDDDVDLDDLEWEAQNLIQDSDEDTETFDGANAEIDLPDMPIPPDDVVNDPIALLEWLENNAEGSRGRSFGDISILRVIPIGKTPPPVGSHLRHITLGEGIVTHIGPLPFDDSGAYISADFKETSRSFVFPRAFENGIVELLG